MPEDQPDLFDKLLELLAALVMPVWGDLILLIPIVLGVLVLVFFIVWAIVWRRAGARNERRLISRSPGTPPPDVHLPGPSWWPFVAPIAFALILFGVLFWPLLIVVGLLVGLIPLYGWLRDAGREWRRTALADEAAGAHGHGMLSATAAVAALPAGTWRVVHAPPQLVAEAPAAAVEPEPVREPPPGVHMPGPSPWPFFAPIALTVIFFGLIFNPILAIGGIILGVVSAAGWLIDANREWRSTDDVGHAIPRTRDPREAWPRRVVPLFTWVIVVSLVLIALPSVGTWLGSLKPAAATPTPLVVPAQPEITASSEKSFETSLLVVPSGRAFQLLFHNRQAGVPHNVEIANGPDRATVFLDGAIITGPADVTYDVPELAAGDYYFLCKIHPNMNGKVEARPETGAPTPSP